MVQNLARELVELVEAASVSFRQINESAASVKPGHGKWSKKEILGHLIDSATNNNHRFVRAQQVDSLIFPHYEQEHWVTSQGYGERSWTELIELWRLFNRHLAQVIERIPERSLSVTCTIGPYEPQSLNYILQDYLVHLKHHLGQMGFAER
jgi:hypothetical protein